MTPSEHEEFFKHSKTLKRGFSFLAKGEKIEDDNPYAVGIAFGVEETLNLELNQEVVLMARTVDGQINVVDAAVKHVFGNASATLADKLIFLPLKLAQELYQTDGVGTVGVLLENQRDLPAVREEISALLADSPEELQIVPWDEESEMYKLTRRMFDMIFRIVFIILIVIVTMSVMNTMGLAILERTTEIRHPARAGFEAKRRDLALRHRRGAAGLARLADRADFDGGRLVAGEIAPTHVDAADHRA